MRPLIVVAVIAACVPAPAAPDPDRPLAGPTPEQRAEDDRLANEKKIAAILSAAEIREAREAEEADAAAQAQRTQREAYCAPDRAERRAHLATHAENLSAVAAGLRARQQYATKHCRRVNKNVVESSLVEDSRGYVRVQRDVVDQVPVWRCPKGAPDGIDGNSDVSAAGLFLHEDFNIIVEGRKNTECHDVVLADDAGAKDSD